jgi:hypothetical protein
MAPPMPPPMALPTTTPSGKPTRTPPKPERAASSALTPSCDRRRTGDRKHRDRSPTEDEGPDHSTDGGAEHRRRQHGPRREARAVGTLLREHPRRRAGVEHDADAGREEYERHCDDGERDAGGAGPEHLPVAFCSVDGEEQHGASGDDGRDRRRQDEEKASEREPENSRGASEIEKCGRESTGGHRRRADDEKATDSGDPHERAREHRDSSARRAAERTGRATKEDVDGVWFFKRALLSTRDTVAVVGARIGGRERALIDDAVGGRVDGGGRGIADRWGRIADGSFVDGCCVSRRLCERRRIGFSERSHFIGGDVVGRWLRVIGLRDTRALGIARCH